jgi:hypothetical protein
MATMSGVSSPQSRAELAQLRALVEKLQERIEKLEAAGREPKEAKPPVDEWRL